MSRMRYRTVEATKIITWMFKPAPRPTNAGSANAKNPDEAMRIKNILYSFNFARAAATGLIANGPAATASIVGKKTMPWKKKVNTNLPAGAQL